MCFEEDMQKVFAKIGEIEAEKEIKRNSYTNSEYRHFVEWVKQGNIVNLRFHNWNGSGGQLKDNERYEIELPFVAALYTQATYIEVNNNKLSIKAQKANTWHDETIIFFIN